MDTHSPAGAAEEIKEEEFTKAPLKQEILRQVDRVTGSSHFRNSKRYPALLRYIVEEALAGNSEALKERTLGLCVFERSADYDTNLDPVVRVSAGEVRKRIAQYYQTAAHEELRMEIPLGSYVPRFYRPGDPRYRKELSGHEALSDEPADKSGSGEAIYPVSGNLQMSQAPVYTHIDASFPAKVQPTSIWQGTAVSFRQSRTHLPFTAGCVLVLVALATLGWFMLGFSQTPTFSPQVGMFWSNIVRVPSPTLIVLGVHSFDAQGNDISDSSHAIRPQPQQTLLSAMTRADMVHLSDVTSYGALTKMLTEHHHAYRTQGAEDTTLEELRQTPFILIGGFNNLWTTRLSQALRFRFVTLGGRQNVIQDSRHPERIWTLDNTRSALSNSRDYGLISCFYDTQTEQYAMLAGGIGKSGTEAAADFLTNGKELDRWFRAMPKPAGSNVQVVVATDVIEGKHGPPHVIAYTFW